MKDLMVGLAVGMITGAIIGSSPKGRKIAGEVKQKLGECNCRPQTENGAAVPPECGCAESDCTCAD